MRYGAAVKLFIGAIVVVAIMLGVDPRMVRAGGA